MNISKLIILVMGIALIVLIVKQSSMNPVDGSALEQKGALEVIHARKSVRSYTDRQVSRGQVDTLIRAGMAAPTARNVQPWFFVAVDDCALLDSLAEALPYAKMLSSASVAIVVCGDTIKAVEGKTLGYWQQDCSAATQNVLLAAEAIGLGAVWTGVYPNMERAFAVSRILKLPEHIKPLAVIPVGYPGGNEQPKDKWKPENMRWNLP
ncbi:MAG: nitroreductase family protein [Breznakibacter sp.]